MGILVQKTKCHYDSISLTLNLLKRFDEKNGRKGVNFDLALMSCFFIVSKFHEYWGKVKVDDLIRFSGGQMRREQIVEMEGYVLEVLDFELCEEEEEEEGIVKMIVEDP